MRLASNYAQALYDLSRTNSISIDLFLAFLKKKGHIKLLPSILLEFEKIDLKKRDENTITFTVARNSDFENFKSILADHLSLSGEIFTKEIIDETIIGGYVLEKGETVIDASYKTKLLNIYQSAIA